MGAVLCGEQRGRASDAGNRAAQFHSNDFESKASATANKAARAAAATAVKAVK